MRGSPVIRGLVVVAALLLLLVPLVRMTSGGSPAVPPAASVAPREADAVELRITSSTVPFTFSVSHLGNVIWEGRSPDPRVETEVQLAFPPEGIDLVVSADWETSAPAAVEVVVSRNDHEPLAQTVWGETSLVEVLTFR